MKATSCPINIKTLKACKILNFLCSLESVALFIAGVIGHSDKRKRAATIIRIDLKLWSYVTKAATIVVANRVM